jgi:hypothetical protein
MAYKARSTRFQTERLSVAIRLTGTFAWSRGVLLNLSSGGAQIYSQAKFAPGAEIEIEFVTVGTEGKSLKTRMVAKVVWYSGFRYGVQFRKKIKRP